MIFLGEELVSRGSDNLESSATYEELKTEAKNRFNSLKRLIPPEHREHIKRSSQVIIDLGSGRAKTGTMAIDNFLDSQSPATLIAVDADKYDDSGSIQLREQSRRYLHNRSLLHTQEEHYGKTIGQFADEYDKPPAERADVVLLSQVESSNTIPPDVFQKLVKPGGYVIELGINGNVKDLSKYGFELVADKPPQWTADRETRDQVWRKKSITPLK